MGGTAASKYQTAEVLRQQSVEVPVSKVYYEY